MLWIVYPEITKDQKEVIKLNRKIRAAAVAAGVPIYKIAMQLGISEVTLYRYLRAELPEEKKKAILAAIEKLSKEENE